MKLKVTVKEKHVEEGVRGHCGQCALALAINDCLSRSGHESAYQVRASVRNLETTLLSGLLKIGTVQNSQEVRDFLERFDDDRCVGVALPITFEMDVEPVDVLGQVSR